MVLSDDRRGQTLALGPREWRLVAAMDGTRDAAGVRAAAGVRVADEELRRFVTELAGLGLLDAEPGEPASTSAFARDLPLEVLEGARFRCDGRGDCCGSFDSILFTPLEQARARAAAPEVLDGGDDPGRVFLPAYGLDDALAAVAAIDGTCAYRDAATGRCRIHPARPHGCRSYPLAPLDVGDAIRVSLRTDCACALDLDGPPLETPARGGELPRALHVPRLPARVTIAEGEDVSREAYLAWLDARLAEARGDAPLEALSAIAFGDRDPVAGLAEPLARLRARHAFRAPHDPTRRALEAATRALDRAPAPLPEARERAFLRARLFVLWPEPTARDALAAVVLTLALARRFAPEDRAAMACPIASADALRAHGLRPAARAVRP